jgi:hypothetical protein
MIYVKEGLRISLAVLELLRNDDELKNVDITVRCFTNCREQGLTFTVYAHEPFAQTTYCVYEHRNSDSIIVNHKDDWNALNGELPYMADSKSVYDKSFDPGEYDKCANYLKETFLEWIKTHEEYKESKKERGSKKSTLQNAVSTL